jgi:hypothetical protein
MRGESDVVVALVGYDTGEKLIQAYHDHQVKMSALENDYIRNGIYDNYFRLLSCVDWDVKYLKADGSPAYNGTTFHLPRFGNRYIQVGNKGNIWSTILMELLTGKRAGEDLDTSERGKDGTVVKQGGRFSGVTDEKGFLITTGQPYDLPKNEDGKVVVKGRYMTSKGSFVEYEFEVLTPLTRGSPDQENLTSSRVEIKVNRRVDGSRQWRESYLVLVQDLPPMRHSSIVAKAIKNKLVGKPVHSLNTRAYLENAKVSFSTSFERSLFYAFVENEIGGELPDYALRIQNGRIVYSAHFFIQLMQSFLKTDEFISSSRHLGKLFGCFYPNERMNRSNAWEALTSQEPALVQMDPGEGDGSGGREVYVFGMSFENVSRLKAKAKEIIQTSIVSSKHIARMIVGSGVKSRLQVVGEQWDLDKVFDDLRQYWMSALNTIRELHVLPRVIACGLSVQNASGAALERLHQGLESLGIIQGTKFAQYWKMVHQVWLNTWRDMITAQISEMNGISEADAIKFVTATTWDVRNDPGARVEALAKLFLKASEAGIWSSGGLVLSIPRAVLPGPALQFHAARIDAGFKSAATNTKLKVKLVDPWGYVLISYHVPHKDGCPRVFLVRFLLDGSFNVNGFQAFVSWANSDVLVNGTLLAKKNHWYSPFYDSMSGRSTIDAVWQTLDEKPNGMFLMEDMIPVPFKFRMLDKKNSLLELVDATFDDQGRSLSP